MEDLRGDRKLRTSVLSDKNNCTCSGYFGVALASSLIGLFSHPHPKASRLRINQSIDWGRLWGMGSSRMTNSFSFDEDNIIPGAATLGYIDRQTSFSR